MKSGRITFISAGAGSGKTTRLTEILCEKLLKKEAKPEGIIATTFTVKAATELKERVRIKLLDENRHDLAVSMAGAQIGTVNSVCGGLLKRFAFELGLTMEQNVLDENAAMERLSCALDDSTGPKELEAVTALAERLGYINPRNGKQLWKEHVSAIIDHARYNDIDPGRFSTFAEENADDLLALFPEALSEIPDRLVLSEIAAVKPFLEDALAQKEVNVTREYYELLRRFDNALQSGTAVWNDWKRVATPRLRKELVEVLEGLRSLCGSVASHPRLHEDLRAYLKTVFAIAEKALATYQQTKRELGFVDFADQESRMLAGLDNPAVREQLGDKLDLLLVDEFQDTSPIQLALFLKLAVLAGETYWVGDVKQAIYGFRGGDARLMHAVLDYLKHGDKEVLPYSWRTVPSLVNAVNSVFKSTFDSMLDPEDIVLEPKREEHPRQSSCFQWVLEGKKLESQCREVAGGVRWLFDSAYEVHDKEQERWRPVRYDDIAILARTNSHVQDIAGALKRGGIPVATLQPGLLSSPEGVFLVAALRRLLDPSDTLATAELYSLATCSEPEEWIQSRLDCLKSSSEPDLWLEEGDEFHPALREIAALRDKSMLMSPHKALEALTSMTGSVRYVLAWCRNGDEATMRLRNIQAVVELAQDYEEECTSRGVSPGVRGLVNWFTEIAEEEKDFFPESPTNAVRVLTYHKSKGLEWPVVILFDLDKRSEADVKSPVAAGSAELDASDPLRDRFIRFWPMPFSSRIPFDGIGTVRESSFFREGERLAQEESARLLYVAMTRARDCLVLCTLAKYDSCAWLDQAGASCFANGDGETVKLPDGGRLRCIKRGGFEIGKEAGSKSDERQALSWFSSKEPPVERMPEQVSPSLQEAVEQSSVVETVVYGRKLDLRQAIEPAEKGTVVHDMLAFALTQKPGICNAASVTRMTDAYTVPDFCDPDAFVLQLETFRSKLTERWPAQRMFVETPIEQVLPENQVLKGQIDLLLETPEGWVVIDHKIMLLEREQWEERSKGYSGQLAAYKQALEAVTGKPVESCWINFFASGGLVHVTV